MAEAASDPSKLVLATQAYREVLKYPGAALAPHALLRIGQASERGGDRTQAATSFARLLKDFPHSEATRDVPAWARP